MLTIIPIKAFIDNYIWLIINEKTKEALCIDPGDADPVLKTLITHQLTLKHILLTHHHNDHMGGVAALLKAYPNVSVFGPKDNRISSINQPYQQTIKPEGFDLTFTVIPTPGHTATHICYYEAAHLWLFCGDTLFSAGCGRVFDSTIEKLHDSLQTLSTLPDATSVYCAHEYTLANLRFAVTVEPDNAAIQSAIERLDGNQCPSLPSTIAHEKRINPFFRTNMPEVINFIHNKGIKNDDSLSVFTCLRQEKNQFQS